MNDYTVQAVTVSFQPLADRSTATTNDLEKDVWTGVRFKGAFWGVNFPDAFGLGRVVEVEVRQPNERKLNDEGFCKKRVQIIPHAMMNDSPARLECASQHFFFWLSILNSTADAV